MSAAKDLAAAMLDDALAEARRKKALKRRTTTRPGARTSASKEVKTKSHEIQRGDVIRVRDWPGTAGTRFKVIEITPSKHGKEICHALEIEGGKPWRYRAFPLNHCSIDAKATKLAREETGDEARTVRSSGVR